MTANVPLAMRDSMLAEGGLDVEMLSSISLVHHMGNTAMRRHLGGGQRCKLTPA